MFIGASPGSTGGVVKTTTFGVIVAAVWATVRGHRDVSMFRRRLPPELVSRAFALSILAAVGLVLATGLLLMIAEVPLALQAKLLRLLEAREFRSLGSTESQPFTGRFVAATNKQLADEVKAGRFREDLLYRLDVFSVQLPPLRQRRADIAGLAELLLTQLAKKYERPKPMLKAEDLAALNAHSFPGNVRELRNVLERSLLRTADDGKWLALDLNWLTRTAPAAASMTTPAPTSTDEALPPDRKLTPVEEQEYRLIRATLRECHGGIRRSATKLGLSPQALLRLLEKWPELRETKP